MAEGMLNIQPQAQQQPAQQPATQQQKQPERQVQPSTNNPEDDLKVYMAKGLELISSPETRDGIIKMLGSSDPVQSLANTLVMVMQRLDTASRAQGLEVDDAIKVIGANQICQELGNIAAAAKIFTLDADHIELAFSVAIQEYVKNEAKIGRINPEKLRAQIMSGANKLPPEEQAEMQKAMQRIQATGQKYSAQIGKQQPQQPQQQSAPQPGQQMGGMNNGPTR